MVELDAAQCAQAITLTQAELHALTGYRRACDQLKALHAAGYWRARLAPTGRVVLERVHFEAVCKGQTTGSAAPRPKLRAAA